MAQTNLNASIDRILAAGPGKRMNKTFQPSVPLGPSYGVDYTTSKRGAEIRSQLDNILKNLQNAAGTAAVASNEAINTHKRNLNDIEKAQVEAAAATVNRKVAPRIESIQSEEDLRKFMDDLGLSQGPSWLRPVENVVSEGLSRAGDIISRPLYAVSDAQLRVQKALDEGQNPFGTLDDALYGGWRGASGQSKTTPGDIMEYMSDSTVDRSNRGLFGDIASWAGAPFYKPAADMSLKANQELGQGNPISKNINRVQGFLGETIGDPANALGAKGVGIVANEAGKGIRATKEAIEQALPRYAEEALQNAPDVVKIHRTAVRNAGKFTGQTRTVAQEVGDNLADTLERAAMNPGDMTLAIQNQTVVDTVRQEVVRGTLESLNRDFDSAVQRLRAGKFQIGDRRYQQYVANSPQWQQFDRAIQDAISNNVPITDDIMEAAWRDGQEYFVQEAVDYANEFEKVMRANSYNTFAVRVGGKELPVKTIGKINKAVKSKGIGAPSAVSFNRQLPGYTGIAVGNARRAGHVAFEEFSGRVRQIAKDFTPEERIELSRLRHMYGDTIPISITGKMRGGLELLQREYADILAREKAAGVVPVGYEDVHNYQYVASRRNLRNLKNNQRALGEVKAARAKELANPDPIKGAGWHSTGPLQAEKMGVKDVITDPFEALAHRRLKSERLVSRSTVSESFFQHYGAVGHLSDDALDQMNLVKVFDSKSGTPLRGFKVNENLKLLASKEGDLYLPKSVGEAYRNFVKMADFNNTEELRGLLLALDKMTNFFKITATVPFPGFHVKNMIGDIYLGYMDGVRLMDYTAFQRAVTKDNFEFADGTVLSRSEFNDLFARNAGGSGFVENEYFPALTQGGPGIRGRARQAKEFALDVSERREDWGRKVHFYKALRDEVADGKNWEKAVENATWRVNKWKFDYGALTYTEKTWLRRIIPFYTFMRKSAPAMLEGLITHPSIYGKTHRFFDNEQDWKAPQWLREIGFATPFAGTGIPFIGGSEEPLAIPKSVIPLDTFQNILGDSSLQEPGAIPGNILRSIISSSSPALKSAVELGTNRNTFTGRELFPDGASVGGVSDYLASNFAPPYATARRLPDQIANQDFGEFLFGSRFAAGIGGRRLDLEAQQNSVRSDLGHVKSELGRISDSIAPYGIKIYVSESQDSTSIKVRQLGTRKDLYVGDLQGALDFVNNYTANPNNLVGDGGEIVRYVTKDGKVKTGRADSPDLDKVLD